MNDGVLLKNCLALQLSEVEMLSSMYPNKDEFIISLPYVLADMNKYVSGDSTQLPQQLDFLLNLILIDIKEKLELNVCLPHEYPHLKPNVYARSTSLQRNKQKQLNCALADFLQTLSPGDLCILTLIGWLTENAAQFFTLNCQSSKKESFDKSGNASDIMCRMWIYSHHIYNKFKRRDIVDTAKNFKFTGFSLPGKPGFICVEGFKKDCDEFLQDLKQMSWKKISLVKEEMGNSVESEINAFRKFEAFSEISFQVRKGPAREYHMDMGQFLKYLERHSCSYAFWDLLGLEGQISAEK